MIFVNAFTFGKPPGRREIDLFTERGPKQREIGVDFLKRTSADLQN